MVLKLAMTDQFRFKVVSGFRTFIFPEKTEVHYIGGSEVLPAPLEIDEENEMISKLGTKEDAAARKMLIEHNLRLVVYIAKKFDNTGVGVEDLISIGTIGLIKAMRNFDTSLNLRFSTYAVPMIIGEIRRFLRDSSPIRISRSLRDTAYKVLQTRQEIEAKTNEEASYEEVAAALGMPVFEVVYAMDAISDPVSLFNLSTTTAEKP